MTQRETGFYFCRLPWDKWTIAFWDGRMQRWELHGIDGPSYDDDYWAEIRDEPIPIPGTLAPTS